MRDVLTEMCLRCTHHTTLLVLALLYWAGLLCNRWTTWSGGLTTATRGSLPSSTPRCESGARVPPSAVTAVVLLLQVVVAEEEPATKALTRQLYDACTEDQLRRLCASAMLEAAGSREDLLARLLLESTK